MKPVAAPPLPPVIVGSRSAGDGHLYLNAGIAAHNATLFAAEKPGEVPAAAPRGLVTALRVALFTGIAATLAVLLPIEVESIPEWVAGGWAFLAALGVIGLIGTVAIDIREAVLAIRHSRALKSWRARLEGALYGHRELLVDVDRLRGTGHGRVVMEFAAALEQARSRALREEDGHDLRDLEEKLLHALGALARYARDDEPGRRRAAEYAVTAFERATIEHVAKEPARV